MCLALYLYRFTYVPAPHTGKLLRHFNNNPHTGELLRHFNNNLSAVLCIYNKLDLMKGISEREYLCNLQHFFSVIFEEYHKQNILMI
jgi:hypothetical protein